MYDSLTVLGISILILLFILILLIFNSRSLESSLITGFWKADADFCNNAELELFLVYFGEGSSISSNRPGYIIAQNSTGLIMNNPVNFSLSGGHSIKPGLSKYREYKVYIDWIDEEGYDDYFPSEQILTYYPDCGKIVFSKDDTVYAVLYKDHVISDINRTMPESTLTDTTSDTTTDTGEI